MYQNFYKIEDLLNGILKKLETIEQKISTSTEDELLTPKELSKKYNIPYPTILKILNSGEVKVNSDTRPMRILDSEFKKYYKRKES